MTSLIVLNNHKENLKIFQDQPVEILSDFCKSAWNFLSKGTNIKLYQAASQKLQIDIKQIQNGVESLAYLFLEASKNNLNEECFKETVLGLGLPENMVSVVYSGYLDQKSILDLALPQMSVQHYQFKDLEWRLEVQVSSRAMKSKMKPRVIMKLDLEKGGETESVCLQSDIPNVLRMNQLFNEALQESKTHHSKRIQRAVT